VFDARFPHEEYHGTLQETRFPKELLTAEYFWKSGHLLTWFSGKHWWLQSFKNLVLNAAAKPHLLLAKTNYSLSRQKKGREMLYFSNIPEYPLEKMCQFFHSACQRGRKCLFNAACERAYWKRWKLIIANFEKRNLWLL